MTSRVLVALRIAAPPSRVFTAFTAEIGQWWRPNDLFEHVDGGTRVVVEHLGWDGIPQEHAARHGFPLLPFQQRLAEWWQALLDSLATASTT